MRRAAMTTPWGNRSLCTRWTRTPRLPSHALAWLPWPTLIPVETSARQTDSRAPSPRRLSQARQSFERLNPRQRCSSPGRGRKVPRAERRTALLSSPLTPSCLTLSQHPWACLLPPFLLRGGSSSQSE